MFLKFCTMIGNNDCRKMTWADFPKKISGPRFWGFWGFLGPKSNFWFFLEKDASDLPENPYLDRLDHYLQLSNWSHVQENSSWPFFGHLWPFLGLKQVPLMDFGHFLHFGSSDLHSFLLLFVHYIYYKFIAFTIISLHLLSVHFTISSLLSVHCIYYQSIASYHWSI